MQQQPKQIAPEPPAADTPPPATKPADPDNKDNGGSGTVDHGPYSTPGPQPTRTPAMPL
ncbi:hypothetical protein [Kitasatospora sp. NPDC057738]|uniref:hypothetical protein n=1 Tax=Kitasatospora sp. NPDC057738 TaxID=3346233 RepID=UPI0036BAC427